MSFNNSSMGLGSGGGTDHFFGGFSDELVPGMNLSVFNSTQFQTAQTTTTSSATFSSNEFSLNLERLKWVVGLVFIPSVVVIGLIGNIISLILISRDGVHKSSNVLLIALALSDTCFLSGSMFSVLYTEFVWFLLPYSKGVCLFIYYVYTIFQIVLLNFGLFCSHTFPMLITVERLCAIFFPLKFQLIITPLRTLSAVLVISSCYGAYVLFLACCYSLSGPYSYNGKSVMIISASPYYFRYQEQRQLFSVICNELTGTVPFVVLILGSLVISYKVKMAARRRAMMMSQGGPDKQKTSSSQSRTTKTLLAVCVTFVVLVGISYIYHIVSIHVHMSKNAGDLGEVFKTLVICINSSCNFFIYIINNKKFKDQLVAMFSGKGKNRSKPNITYSEYSTKVQ